MQVRTVPSDKDREKVYQTVEEDDFYVLLDDDDDEDDF